MCKCGFQDYTWCTTFERSQIEPKPFRFVFFLCKNLVFTFCQQPFLSVLQASSVNLNAALSVWCHICAKTLAVLKTVSYHRNSAPYSVFTILLTWSNSRWLISFTIECTIKNRQCTANFSVHTMYSTFSSSIPQCNAVVYSRRKGSEKASRVC